MKQFAYFTTVANDCVDKVTIIHATANFCKSPSICMMMSGKTSLSIRLIILSPGLFNKQFIFKLRVQYVFNFMQKNGVLFFFG